VNAKTLAEGIRKGQRRPLARALTLVESAQPQHQALSLELFNELGSASRAYRLGVTGPPGAGKSTLIECIVLNWLEQGQKVAVLAIDPTSQRTGGSLLGDKTRMGRIAQHPDVFIRPSPTGTHLGGLGKRTPLMCALLERAGFDRIVVETVGVGQSEISASHLVNCLLLVALPGAGDEVQGLKRGLMEEVDLVAVNKADLGGAKASVATLRSALRVFRREVPVLAVSAQTQEGLDQLFQALEDASDKPGTMSELYFLEQFLIEALKREFDRCSPEWHELQEMVRGGEVDLLQALPRLERLVAEFRGG
jgi:LAO/AO transport system kinase